MKTPIILYIWKPITDMLADKSISKFVYTFIYEVDDVDESLQP